jgi:hypothetical protein
MTRLNDESIEKFYDNAFRCYRKNNYDQCIAESSLIIAELLMRSHHICSTNNKNIIDYDNK